jgi:enoyl-CoA hydratase/carnithine racemase
MSIKTKTLEGIAIIEIARPEKKNAITAAMYQRMTEALTAANDDTNVRAVLIHGQADVFTAGNDLDDFLQNPPTTMDAEVFDFMRVLSDAEKPVVAAVNGAAVGIGTTMLMHCDLVYCADNAIFSTPFVNLGLCPEFASSLLLPMNAGYHKAAEKLLLGEPFDAVEALEMRIVNRILPREEVLGHAQARAARFSALPPDAVRASKQLLRRAWKSLAEQAIADEAEAFAKLLGSPAAKEALTAFFERRKPDFSHCS